MEANGENDDIDEDIHRLQIVLQDEEGKEEESDAEGELQSLHQDAEDEHRSYMSRSRPSTCSDVTASSYPATSFGPEGEDKYLFLDPNNVNPESCLAMNRAYQEVLLDLLRQTEMSLNENRHKQKQLEEDIERLSSGNKQTGFRSSGKSIASVNIPYFKDQDGNYPPDNEDVHAKRALQEGKQQVRPQTSWSKFARKKLISAVAMDSLEKMLRPVMSRLELESEKLRQCRNQEEIDICKDRIETLQEEIANKRNIPERELIQNVDADKVDWMKISVSVFDSKMDAADGERIWRNVLRPEINRDKWSENEEALLDALVAKYSMRNWKMIAQELGTNRTPFQCLQHYQQHSQVYDSSPWTPEEDELLKEVVETCKFGKDAVHFHQVAYYIEGRSSQMCQKRWQEINPLKKRGRWTKHEDCLLIAAVKMLGMNNWGKVATLVPSRNSQQCRERWFNVLSPELGPKQWNYEDDKTLLRLVQQHGSNWSQIARYLKGRTDNNILQRYRRLMAWKQQCEEFFAMSEKTQKLMILGHRETDYRKQYGRKRKKGQPPKPSMKDLSWYKKAPYEHYSDVGFFAKQLGYEDEIYDKIIEDRRNNELVAPRPLPVMHCLMARSQVAIWNRKRNLQKLVESEIKKTLDENPENEGLPKLVAERVALNVVPMVEARERVPKQMVEISSAMRGKAPHELSVKELLRISRHIKTTGKAPEDIEEANDEFDDYDSMAEDVVGSPDDKPKHTGRVLNPQHKQKMMMGREKHFEANARLREAIWFKYKKKAARKSVRRRKFRLFPRKVFDTQGATEEQEKLRRKSLLLMLKSMDVDSVKAFKKARRRHNKYSALLNRKADEENHADSSAKQTNHALRPRSRSSAWKQQPRPDAASEMGEATKTILELRKELNIPPGDSESEEEEAASPSKVARLCQENNVDTPENSQQSQTNGPRQNGFSQENPENSQQNQTNGPRQNGFSQENPEKPQQSQTNGTRQNGFSQENNVDPQKSQTNGQGQDSSDNLKAPSNTGSQETGDASQSQSNSGSSNSTTQSSSNSVSVPQVQPYNKKLPFIPPNHTNLRALKTLLLDKEKLFDKACNDFKVQELRNEFYEKQKINATPFVKTLLSVFNPDYGGIRKRARRKLNNDLEKNSFVKCIEDVKKSREFNQLKARFQAIFTWPALISTIKPPKELEVPSGSVNSTSGQTEAQKDSEKENMEDEAIKRVVNLSGYSSTDSDSDMESDRKIQKKRKRSLKDVNDVTKDVNDMTTDVNELVRSDHRPTKKVCWARRNMVKLEYKDLEDMMDVELTEKEELEIIVMNIITKHLSKKKEVPVTYYNRERGKTLRRIGMFDRMKQLEKEEKCSNLDGEAPAEPTPKVKRPRKQRDLQEPRRSSRLSHHKPLEVMRRVRRKVKTEPETYSPEKENRQSMNEVETAACNPLPLLNAAGMMNGAVTNYVVSADGMLIPQFTNGAVPQLTPGMNPGIQGVTLSQLETVTASVNSSSNLSQVAPPLIFAAPPVSSTNETTANGTAKLPLAPPILFAAPPIPSTTGVTSDLSKFQFTMSAGPHAQSLSTVSSVGAPPSVNDPRAVASSVSSIIPPLVVPTLPMPAVSEESRLPVVSANNISSEAASNNDAGEAKGVATDVAGGPVADTAAGPSTSSVAVSVTSVLPSVSVSSGSAPSTASTQSTIAVVDSAAETLGAATSSVAAPVPSGSSTGLVSTETSSTGPTSLANAETASSIASASPVVSVSSGSVSSGKSTPSAIAQPVLFASTSVSEYNSLPEGVSPLGLFTASALPQASTSTVSVNSSSDTPLVSQSTANPLPLAPALMQNNTASASDSPISVTLQAVVGNSIVPVVVQINPNASGGVGNVKLAGIGDVGNLNFGCIADDGATYQKTSNIGNISGVNNINVGGIGTDGLSNGNMSNITAKDFSSGSQTGMEKNCVSEANDKSQIQDSAGSSHVSVSNTRNCSIKSSTNENCVVSVEEKSCDIEKGGDKTSVAGTQDDSHNATEVNDIG